MRSLRLGTGVMGISAAALVRLWSGKAASKASSLLGNNAMTGHGCLVWTCVCFFILKQFWNKFLQQHDEIFIQVNHRWYCTLWCILLTDSLRPKAVRNFVPVSIRLSVINLNYMVFLLRMSALCFLLLALSDQYFIFIEYNFDLFMIPFSDVGVGWFDHICSLKWGSKVAIEIRVNTDCRCCWSCL